MLTNVVVVSEQADVMQLTVVFAWRVGMENYAV